MKINLIIFVRNVPDKICNKTVCKICEIYSLSDCISSFKNEIQFSSNSIMEQLKHRDSDSFCDCNELLLPRFASYYLHDRSLLMSRRNIIFTFFSYLFNSMGT